MKNQYVMDVKAGMNVASLLTSLRSSRFQNARNDLVGTQLDDATMMCDMRNYVKNFALLVFLATLGLCLSGRVSQKNQHEDFSIAAQAADIEFSSLVLPLYSARGSQDYLPLRPSDNQVLGSLSLAESLLPKCGISSRKPRPFGLYNQIFAQEPDVWNCLESVNFATSLSRTNSIYTHWRNDVLWMNQQSEATWEYLDRTLRRGDVVCFGVVDRVGNNLPITYSTHVQVCLGSAAEMWSANNEPRFVLDKNKVPAPTGMWWVCSVRDYYQALMNSDAAWRSLGHYRQYYLVVYHCPETHMGEMLASAQK